MLTRRDALILLGTTLNPDKRSSTESRYGVLDGTGWQMVFERADETMLLPAWFAALRDSGLKRLMPRDLEEAAEAIWQLNCDRSARIVAQAKRLSGWFADAGIPAVHIKGVAHILQGLHGDIGARMTGDFDILVPTDQLRTAAEVVLNHGGTFVQGDLKHTLTLTGAHLHHMHPIKLPDSLGLLELHTDIAPNASCWPSADEVLAAAVPIAGSSEVLVPAQNHALAIAVGHSLLRSVGLPGSQVHLKDMQDVIALLASDVSLDGLRARVISGRQAAALEDMMHLTQAFCGTTELPRLPVGLRGKLRRAVIDAVAFDNRGILKRFKPISQIAAALKLQTLWWLLTQPNYRIHGLRVLSDRQYRAEWRKRRE